MNKVVMQKETEFHKLIGEFAIEASRLESYFSIMLEKLIGNRNELVTKTLMKSNNFNKNIQLVSEIVRINPYKRIEIEAIVSNVDDIRNFRNKIFHGITGHYLNNKSEASFTIKHDKIKCDFKNDKNPVWVLNSYEEITFAQVKEANINIDLITEELKRLILEIELENSKP